MKAGRREAIRRLALLVLLRVSCFVIMFEIDLAVLLFCITLAVEAVGWIGKDTLADLVRRLISLSSLVAR